MRSEAVSPLGVHFNGESYESSPLLFHTFAPLSSKELPCKPQPHSTPSASTRQYAEQSTLNAQRD